MWKRYALVLVTLIISSALAYGYWLYSRSQSSSSDTAQVRITVAGLGDELQKVPLIASKDIVAFAMNRYYAPFVQPDLLKKWEADPLNAPGRVTSSPWPDRIDITETRKNKDGTFTVGANIIEIANSEKGPAKVVQSIPVRFTLTQGPDGWQITGYEKR